jgi:diguanylate cyclase (GGDEF)-like protein
MRHAIIPLFAMLVAFLLGAIGAWHGHSWLVLGLTVLSSGLGGFLLSLSLPAGANSLTARLFRQPALLEQQRSLIAEELSILEDAQELQRGVFEVSAELVGCVREDDARNRFAHAMRRYWSHESADLMVWERGSWRSLGGRATGAAPSLESPVALPQQSGGNLVLDLSPGVAGQAALVLREAVSQPSLRNRGDADQHYVAEVLRGQLALSLRRVMLYGELQQLARIDPLTGAHRRWYGELRLDEMVNEGDVVSVAMVDVDHFKKINDAHGHPAGDRVLAAVGAAILANLRPADLVCRFGGEEFLVIMPETTTADAADIAERLKLAVASLGGLPRPVTVSIGIASCHLDDSTRELISRADKALYDAKAAGRDRVCLNDEPNADGGVRLTSRRKRKAESDRHNVSRANYRAIRD